VHTAPYAHGCRYGGAPTPPGTVPTGTGDPFCPRMPALTAVLRRALFRTPGNPQEPAWPSPTAAGVRTDR